MTTGYASAKISAYAIIAGIGVDVSMVERKFAVNTIPSLSLLLAPGRQAKTLLVSTAHAILDKLTYQVPIEVYLTYKTVGKSGPALMPDGEYLFFKGYVTGLGYRRLFNQVGIAVEATHWLASLNFSSMLCEHLNPSVPWMLSFPAMFGTPLGGNAMFPALGLNAKSFKDVETDLWGKVILPWFKAIASGNHMKFVAPNPGGIKVFGGIDLSTGEVLAALNKFTGGPLPMKLGGELMEQPIAQAILFDIGYTSTSPANGYQSTAYITFWEKLIVSLAGEYMFSCIPFIDHAKIVPFIPGLRNFYDPYGMNCTIRAMDITAADRTDMKPRPLRGVGIAGSPGSMVGLMTPEAQGQLVIGGVTDTKTAGLIVIKPAPRWISNLLVPKLALDGIGCAFVPNPGVPQNFPDPKDLIKGSGTLLDSLARAYYVNEVLKNRNGFISGPLRFDVCPGSTIKYEAPSGKWTAGAEPLGTYLYASVIEVADLVDAGNTQAGTTYKLHHIRNTMENSSDITSIAQHPLYNYTWVGESLQ